MTDPNANSELPVHVLREIDAICSRFEEACRRGELPRAEQYLPDWTGAARDRLLQELLLLEIDYRRRVKENRISQGHARRLDALQQDLAKSSDGESSETPDVDLASEEDRDQTKFLATTGSGKDPNIGRIVGNFEIVSWLGGGGMGNVYRARHTMIRCERAVKLLKPALAGHPQAVRRFLREAQAVVDALDHDNIIKAFDVGSIGNEVYLVMEFVEGEDLAQRVRRTGPFVPEKAVELVEHAANGLAVAHTAGFVHRDIKPSNLMLTRDGVLKILDLGLIRILEDPDVVHERTPESKLSDSLAPMSLFASQLTDGRAVLGTLAYMAPEQARNPQEADGRSDIYSLGCTLYFLLTGQHPFGGETPHEILEKHQFAEFPLPRALRPDIPPSLEAIVLQMMRVRPEDRYETAGQVARALRAWRLQESLSGTDGPTVPVTYESKPELESILLRLKILTPEQWTNTEHISGRWTGTVAYESPNLTSRGIADEMLQSLQSERVRVLTPFQATCIARGDADLLRMPRHVLSNRIGKGWKGEVFEAWNVETDNRLREVVRTFSPEALRGLEGDHNRRLQGFMERAGRIAAVRHPVFPRVLAFDSFAHRLHERLTYLASEQIAGVPVNDMVQSPRWHTEAERAAWAVQAVMEAARGLVVAHAQNVLHLDIHDKSMMVTTSGEVRLVDLGIAELIIPRPIETTMSIGTMSMDVAPRLRKGFEATSAHAFSDEVAEASGLRPDELPDSTPVGTPNVMPPEQWLERSRVSPAIDVYNLGCVLCYLVTGRYPFEGNSVVKIMQQHLTSPAGKSQAVRNLPGALRTIAAKMLEKRPADRFWSVSEVAEALEQLPSFQAPKKWWFR